MANLSVITPSTIMVRINSFIPRFSNENRRRSVYGNAMKFDLPFLVFTRIWKEIALCSKVTKYKRRQPISAENGKE